MDGVSTVLSEARAAGLAVWAEDDRLVVRGPRAREALARQLLEAKPAVLAALAAEEANLAWRVAAMRARVPARGPIPLLVARDLPPAADQCLSCGGTLDAGRMMRCALCVRAAQIALGWEREGVGP
jgi:hypothetical protein